MTNAKFSTFPQEVSASWRIFRATWRTSAKVIFLPLIPLVFTFPYLIILYTSLQTNEFPALNLASIFTGVIALIAVIAFLMLLEIIRVALFATYASGRDLGARKALQIGTRRFPAFLWTDVLALIYLVVAMIPFAILIFWNNNGGNEMLYSIFHPVLAGIILFVAFIVFLLPLVILAVWLTFAQIAVATGRYSGIHALTYSTTLVRPVMFTILKKLVAWIILASIVSYAVSPLPVFYWLIPLIIKLLGVAFLVVLYKEITGTAVLETKSARPRRTRVKTV